ncbi:CRISPR-associated protein Cas2 [Escherichia coli]|uniref:CRISPR-associated protein Cas2 n=1 Tax=Escherichia coli TaxID=562 RepID=UPI000D157BA7|nr:CRISPR-associated protein Cas2 [Escherichia coli]EJY8894334.1 hypothetical protein [Escherichia coli]MBC0549954.1 CRISPR-associated protein Cas2 [Escherichia coli]MDI0643847.1 hypothetical protein [Escherichia coli]MEC9712005.1 CRISPR-associated protein Cas2 [Escherichia coli]MED8707848.1 CRISPR-associated protein Cas2 [Escherichia coli]
MDAYIISYDLVKNEDYEPIFEKIKSFGLWAKVVESTWVVVTDLSCIDIRDGLASVVDSSSRIFVVQSAGAAAWRNSICSNEWLKTNL